MNYIASVADFFKNPKWMMNLLLGGVCALIPIVGPIVLMGWFVTAFWARDDENYGSYPDFDFNQFARYLERGLWPFLVVFATTVGLTVIAMIVIMPLTIVAGILTGQEGEGIGCFGAMAWLLTSVVYVALIIATMMVVAPLKIRASMMQEFGRAFDFRFVKRFVAMMWKEILIASLFTMIAAFVLSMVGMLVLCIGMYFAMVLIYFAWAHLSKQLYVLYLARGGDPVPLSPKLTAPRASPSGV